MPLEWSGKDGSHTELRAKSLHVPGSPADPKHKLWLLLVGSGSEMFGQEIIYVLVFQRPSTCKRERGKRKSQYENKSNSSRIFFL